MSYLRRASAEPGMPDDLIGEPVLMMVSVWIGDLADAAGIHEGLWGSAGSVFTGIHTTSFVELQSVNDEMLGAGLCNYTKGGYLGSLSADCIESLLTAADRLPSPLSVVEVSYTHGAQDRVDDAATGREKHSGRRRSGPAAACT